MSRGIEHSGGPLHIKMVKEATKMIVDRFDTMEQLAVNYEERLGTSININVQDHDRAMSMRSIDFRPDIHVRHTPPRERGARGHQLYDIIRASKWERIEDSRHIVIEVETNPSNIFRNVLKKAYYARLKDDDDGRKMYAFILVAPEGAKLPSDTEPFDEVWTIPKSKLEEVSVR